MKTRYLFGLGLIIIVILILGIPLSHAQEDETESLFTTFTNTFDGYLKHSTAVQLDEFDQFTKIYTCLTLKYSNWFGDYVRLTVEGKAVYDAVYDIEDGLNPDDEDDYRAYLDLREAVIGLSFDKFDLHLGKQQVVWGKTDGFRVTDVVNPLDLRDNASTEFLDQRIPLWMATIEYYFTTDFSLQALILLEMRFNELPSSEFPEGTLVNATKEPDESVENTEYGVRLTGFKNGWDFTLNYLYSWDDIPAFKQSFDESSDMLTISPEHERLHIVGGTFATVVWDGVVRGELAAKIGKYFSVIDPSVSDMVAKKTLLNYALAFERDLFDIQWTAQALQETILDYEDAITTDEITTYLTLNSSKKLLYEETLEISTFIIYDVNNEQWRFQPAIKYDYTDSIKLIFGVDFIAGGDEEALDEDAEQVYAEVTYSF